MSANDVIRAFKLNFALGNVVKYILRAGRKPDESALDDIQKALWYLNDEYRQRTHSNNTDLEEFAAREQSGNTRRTFIDALCEHRNDD